MPVTMKLSRPNYEKFRVSNLGLNIVGNGSRNYNVSENSELTSNPIYGFKEISHQTPRAERKTCEMFISIRIVGAEPVVSFATKDKNYYAPQIFKATNTVVNKAIESDFRVAKQIAETGATVKMTKTMMNYVIEYVKKYGTVADVSAKTSPKEELSTKKLYFRLLASCVM